MLLLGIGDQGAFGGAALLAALPLILIFLGKESENLGRKNSQVVRYTPTTPLAQLGAGDLESQWEIPFG